MARTTHHRTRKINGGMNWFRYRATRGDGSGKLDRYSEANRTDKGFMRVAKRLTSKSTRREATAILRAAVMDLDPA